MRGLRTSRPCGLREICAIALPQYRRTSSGRCGCDPRYLVHLMLESGPRRGPDMTRSKFTEEQIIAILREQEAGAKTAEVCRRHGISGATFYAWKAKFGGIEEPSEAKRLKALEDENAKLERLLAEACSTSGGRVA
ncbi:hypothetical protein DSD19_04840 [Rhodovulum sp. BSW8]|nr:hypothetical protein DSD19_04840 [Rhodovulum sp. BSW8]